jgi:hypothetical protein
MIKLIAYDHDDLGQVIETKVTKPEPSELKNLGDFPKETENFDLEKPITIICNQQWLACHLVAYAMVEGYDQIRVNKSSISDDIVVIYDNGNQEIDEPEGDQYNSKGEKIN